VICSRRGPRRAIVPVEGRSLPGVHFAIEYLTANTKALLSGKPDA